MQNHLDSLRTQTLEELEEPATRAVRAAVCAGHEAGLRTYCAEADGRLTFTYPDDEVEEYVQDGKKEGRPRAFSGERPTARRSGLFPSLQSVER